VSGTSQAAPYVSNIAGRIKDANPRLKPLQIKKILMGTVDKKDFLKDKVTSGGIVNGDRAVYAATLSRQVSLEEAIERSQVAVLGKKSMKFRMTVPAFIPKNIKPIPMPSQFEF
ncbi:MAG: S8 family serine peptidase, partial [Bacteriovoracia bacterium]